MRACADISQAGGLFAGKVVKGQDAPEGRFGGESSLAKLYRARYLSNGYFAALEDIKAVAVSYQSTMIHCS